MQHNHLVDVVFGALLGTVAAILTYRSSYAAVLDYRYNHVPFAFEKAQQRFPYTEESARYLARESIANRWWGKYDEEKAGSNLPRFNLEVFDGADDRNGANTESGVSPTNNGQTQDKRVSVSDEETRRNEVWKGKQRSTSNDAEIIEGQSCGLSFDGSTDTRPKNQSPPEGSRDMVAESFVAHEAGPSNAGGSSPIDGAPAFALNGVLTRVSTLLGSMDRTPPEEGFTNSEAQQPILPPPKALTRQDMIASMDGIQEGSDSNEQYMPPREASMDQVQRTTSQSPILEPATHCAEEGIFHMEMPVPSRLAKFLNGHKVGSQYEGDRAERGEASESGRRSGRFLSGCKARSQNEGDSTEHGAAGEKGKARGTSKVSSLFTSKMRVCGIRS